MQGELDTLAGSAPIGNENHPETKRLRELQKQLAGDIKKPSYRLQSEKVGIYEINKTEYEYALAEHQKKQPEPIVMPRQEAIEEHKNLVNVLENVVSGGMRRVENNAD